MEEIDIGWNANNKLLPLGVTDIKVTVIMVVPDIENAKITLDNAINACNNITINVKSLLDALKNFLEKVTLCFDKLNALDLKTNEDLIKKYGASIDFINNFTNSISYTAYGVIECDREQLRKFIDKLYDEYVDIKYNVLPKLKISRENLGFWGRRESGDHVIKNIPVLK